MRDKLLVFLKYNRILIVVLILASLVRFYNFPNRITYGPEQAISLLVSGDYINEKFSLLGLPNVQRTTSLGHILFSPAVFNYTLIPLIILSNYNPIYITGYFTLLNLFTGLILYIFVKNIFNKRAAIFSAVIFLFNDLMIFHSMFIWIVNYMPLANIIIAYLFYIFYKFKKSKILPFLIGLLISISIGLEYLYFFTALPLLGLLIYFSEKKAKTLVMFILGLIIGNLPTIIFDLNHNFYHAKTLWQYLLDTLSNPGQSKIAYYHFLQFWPLLAVILGYALSKIYKLSKISAIGLLILYISYNLMSPNISFTEAVGMYKGLNISKIEQAAKMIADDHPENFNVVMTFDFDSRAHPLRYLLKYNFNLSPLGVEDYSKAKSLYIFTTGEYPLSQSSLWEIASFGAKKYEILGSIDGFKVYKAIK